MVFEMWINFEICWFRVRVMRMYLFGLIIGSETALLVD